MRKRFLIFLTLSSIFAQNVPPVILSTPDTTAYEDSEYSYTIVSTDSDGDSVTVTAPTLPEWLSLTTSTQYWVSTYAGAADVGGYIDSTLLESRFSYPRGICIANDGTIYVGDDGNHVLRKISTDGIVTTLAGSGSVAHQDGQGTAASFKNLYGMDLDSDGNIYVADYSGRRIRKVTPEGLVTTYAGNGGWGNVDGPAENAEFYQPYDVAVDNQGNVYVTCTHAYTIRKITPDGMVSTIAGIPFQRGLVDGDSATALLHSPNSIAVDDSGNVYFGDYATLRRITPDGNIITIAGTGTQGHADGQGTSAQIYRLDGLTYDNSTNILYATNYWYECIRAIDQDANVTTIAGNNSTGSTDGDGSVAQFNSPQDLFLKGTSIYISDTGNDIIRRLDLPATTISGTPTNNEVGDHSVSLVATDQNGSTDTQDFTINVINTNDAPVANDSSFTMDEDTEYSGVFTASDIDVGDELFYFVAVDPTNGSVTIADSNSGSFTYSPEADYFGMDSLFFRVFDGEASDTGKVMITILDVGEGPSVFSLLTPGDSTIHFFTYENMYSDSVQISWQQSHDSDDTIHYYFTANHLIYNEWDDSVGFVTHDTTFMDTSISVFYEDIFDEIVDFYGDLSVVSWNVAAIGGSDTLWSGNGPFIFANEAWDVVHYIPSDFDLLHPADSTIHAFTHENLNSDSIQFQWETSFDPDDTVNYYLYAEHMIYDENDDSVGMYVHDTLLTHTGITIYYEDIYLEIVDFYGDFSVVTWNIAAIGLLDTVWSANGPFRFANEAWDVVYYGPSEFNLVAPEDSTILILSNESMASDSVIFEWSTSTDPNDTILYQFSAEHLIFSGEEFLAAIQHDTILNLNMAMVFHEDIGNEIQDFNGDYSVVRWQVKAMGGSDTVMAANGPFHLGVDATSLSLTSDVIPGEFALYQNFPNPFNPVTNIKFDVHLQGHVSLVVYNILGETVATLIDKELTPGNYSYKWNADFIPSGMYIYQMESGEFISTKKLILLK
jgi:hypothetical protein